MTSDFLTHLRSHAATLADKIHSTIPTGNKPAPINPAHVASCGTAASALVAMIDAEIKRPLNSQELEAQHADTRALPGETLKQTADRLKAQDFDNRLVSRP